MKILIVYAIVGWVLYGAWLYEELTEIGAARRAGKFRLLKWYEYVAALPALLVVWPWFLWTIIRVAIGVVIDDESDE